MKTSTVLVLFVLFGLFFISKGITGLVISQSCCTGDNCLQENQCNFNPEIINFQMGNILMGMIILILAIIFWLENHES